MKNLRGIMRIVRVSLGLVTCRNGAEAGTRTPTSLRPLDPESSASANSATSARVVTEGNRRASANQQSAIAPSVCQASQLTARQRFKLLEVLRPADRDEVVARVDDRLRAGVEGERRGGFLQAEEDDARLAELALGQRLAV